MAQRENALRAIALGAYDFCEKPVDLDGAAHRSSTAPCACASWRTRTPAWPRRRRPRRSSGIITGDDGMLKVCRTVERLASVDVPVLLLGESGTGKEALARALHDTGPARRQALRRASTARAIPENLLESELFGHERGAFTGAVKQTIGKIEARQRRHAVPRRDRRHAGPAAGQAAALPAGPGDRAGRRAHPDPGRCARRLGHQPAARGAGDRRPVPRRPAVPAELEQDDESSRNRATFVGSRAYGAPRGRARLFVRTDAIRDHPRTVVRHLVEIVHVE